MLWLEESEKDGIQSANPSQMLDYAYRIQCHNLPVEHAYLLAEAIRAILPWISDEPSVGIHSIHVADSGNGWIRPTGENCKNLLYLSRRTRLVLRLSNDLISKAQNLEGATLIIDGNTLVVEKGKEKPLLPSSTLFARYIVMEEHDEETQFVSYLVNQLQHLNISPRKILCGQSHAIPTPKALIHTRSALIAELNPAESLRLQQSGIGPNRQLGCGLFIPHKDIAPVSKP
uniref:CRISPR-associated protein Cas6, subtype MYXAN n=1 Tax=Candidatus Kentrum eta TaxID=2126337 RepID=A0A450V4F4_9GAMM|nr:MAG: CRISPR-associated protein Cas6, subtype MYXAN [Candidatus Kentron sp. H]VFJ92867.1 MAG: CRISPR-associated protein Cas6, subtype MYXAN [Candidatus Kentron sp. H]VFJ99673.1 MAG: CRISPR-associated protein Cas6, subtype MYXAN [Candidatus Kentron sp. H]